MCDLSDMCESNFVHTDIVKSVLTQMAEDSTINEIADIFRLFGDPTRAKIIFALSKAEMCVCDIASLLNMTSSAVSHQLRLLRQGRILTNRREGKAVIYRLDDEHIIRILDCACEHIYEERSR